MNRRAEALYYAGHAALAANLLAAIPAIRAHPLRVPVTWERDGLFFTVLVKALSEGELLHVSRIGAPFGSDLVDWPLGTWLPLGLMAALARLTGEPGLALNLFWLGSLVAAGVAATYALRRLRLGPGPAFVLGMLYGLQPYGFYRNVEHVNLAFPLVPLLVLLCLRVAGTRPDDETPAERRLTLAACAAQSLSYVYYSAFACAVLAAAVPLGWIRTGRGALVRRAAAAAALLVLGSALTFAPSLVYWQEHGTNPDLDYKPAADTDRYGLKLRHLLTPIEEHPLPPLRGLARAAAEAGFPGDNENVTARLGTVGSLGLVALLLFAVARAAGLGRPDEDLAAPAALTLWALLVSTVGGFASVFSLLVLPDVRAWNRIVVFLSFLCLLAAGHVASRAAARWGRPARPWALRAGLAVLLAAGVADQVPSRTLSALREGTGRAFAEERSFVREIEASLPPGAMVFQLPAMTIPVDRETRPPMTYYDPGRAYVHSRHARWSWGAVVGRTHDWQRAAAVLPVPEMLRVLSLAGFSGVWVDRWGYRGDHRPRFETLEAELAAASGEPLRASTGGRYSYVPIDRHRARLEEALSPELLARSRAAVLADAPVLTLESGCAEERKGEDGWWRSCGRFARLVLRNPRYGHLEVTLFVALRAPAGTRLRLRSPALEGGGERTVPDRPSLHRLVLVLERRQEVPLEIEADGCDGLERPAACFELADLRAATRRIMNGAPVGPPPGPPPP
jgi:phosphoglycerol transferase